MRVCCVCGKLDAEMEDDGYDTCSQRCQDELERLQPTSQRPAHSTPRQIEERPSTPGYCAVPRDDAA